MIYNDYDQILHQDVMANMLQTGSDNDSRQNYMKVAQVYDDGDIHAHYINEVIQEDKGILPIDYIQKR
ncbi:MAG TPA: hypothetical protein VFP49_08805 [Nitrososphaeraceae archaeon]|nr:hypothetical protein [Nitrososphaeraceae archaeon]